MDAPRGSVHLLGRISSFGNAIMLLLGDAEVASKWRGIDNAIGEGIEGSDCERCYLEVHEVDAYRHSAVVACNGRDLLAIGIHVGGWVLAFRVGDHLALVEPCYCTVEEDDDNMAYDGLLHVADFMDYVMSPIGGDAMEAGSVTVGSGAMAFLSASSPGEKIPAALAQLEPAGTVPFESGIEAGLVISLPPGRYRVRIEHRIERSWGEAGRALIERYEKV
jgi:hypothetical protein